MAAEALPPMLRHNAELKRPPQAVLLYRLGDFFEFCFQDAIQLSRLLELTITGKDAGRRSARDDGRHPRVPHHASERYCTELVRRGLSIALCNQLKTSAAKGALLKRGITRVLMPGTVMEEGILAARHNNWLEAVVLEGKHAAQLAQELSSPPGGRIRASSQPSGASLETSQRC